MNFSKDLPVLLPQTAAMRICLVQPPIRDFYTTSVRRQPLGLLYIASTLRRAGHEVLLVNGHTRHVRRLAVPPGFSYLEPYMDHPDPALRFPFPFYSHYGMSTGEIMARIKRSRCDMVMVSSLFTPYHREAEEIMVMAREALPDAVIVAGGHHPTLHPDYLVLEGFADFCITGEGEIPSAALAGCLEEDGDLSTVPGLVWLEGDTLHKNAPCHPDPSSLPEPARDLMLARDLSFYRRRAISALAGRGCPHECRFCTSRMVTGRGRRDRPVGHVISEIENAMDNMGITLVNFEDDNLLASGTGGRELLEALAGLRARRSGLPELTAMNGLSVEHVDEEMVSLMARAGFREINLSLVTVSHDAQRRQGRPFDTGRFSRVSRAAIGLGLQVRAYFILGLPDQTVEEVAATVEFLEATGIPYFPSVFYDVTAPRDRWTVQRSSAFFNETAHLDRDSLIRWFNRCFFRNGNDRQGQ